MDLYSLLLCLLYGAQRGKRGLREEKKSVGAEHTINAPTALTFLTATEARMETGKGKVIDRQDMPQTRGNIQTSMSKDHSKKKS